MTAAASRAQQLAAMARRDLHIQKTYHFQLVTQAANIPLVVFTYFFLGKLVGRPAEFDALEGGYFEFALIGFVTMTFATVALSAFSEGIAAEQRGGTLEVLLVAPAARLSTVLSGSLCVPFGFAAIQSLALFTFGWALAGSGFDPSGIPLAAVLLALTMGSFCALGVLSAALVVVTKRGDPFSGVALQATSLMAGALFPVALLPGPVQSLARFFPAYHGFQGMREVLLGGAGIGDILGEAAMLVGFVAVLAPLSFFAFGRAVSLGRATGTLVDS